MGTALWQAEPAARRAAGPAHSRRLVRPPRLQRRTALLSLEMKTFSALVGLTALTFFGCSPPSCDKGEMTACVDENTVTLANGQVECTEYDAQFACYRDCCDEAGVKETIAQTLESAKHLCPDISSPCA